MGCVKDGRFGFEDKLELDHSIEENNKKILKPVNGVCRNSAIPWKEKLHIIQPKRGRWIQVKGIEYNFNKSIEENFPVLEETMLVPI